MKILELKSTTDRMDEFLHQYRRWKDYNNFYNQDPGMIDIQKSVTGIPCFFHRDARAINQSTDPIVVIDGFTEGKNILPWFGSYNRDKHYIVFSSEPHCDQIAQYLRNIEISYTWVTHFYWLFFMLEVYNSPRRFCFHFNKEYKFNTPKAMRFISTTGLPRPLRTYLKDQLLEKVSYKNFIFKYTGIDHGQPSEQFDMIKFVPGKFDPYTAILEQYQHNIGRTLPITLYNQADFNLVVETDIDYQYGFLLSEKTIKCLITGMPFVVVATPHFLKHLRELGFHTYGGLWDESYDNELDPTKRIDKIVDLCNNLDKFDWAANQTALELIGLKNRSNFLNLDRVIDSGFCQIEQSILELVV